MTDLLSSTSAAVNVDPIATLARAVTGAVQLGYSSNTFSSEAATRGELNARSRPGSSSPRRSTASKNAEALANSLGRFSEFASPPSGPQSHGRRHDEPRALLSCAPNGSSPRCRLEPAPSCAYASTSWMCPSAPKTYSFTGPCFPPSFVTLPSRQPWETCAAVRP